MSQKTIELIQRRITRLENELSGKREQISLCETRKSELLQEALDVSEELRQHQAVLDSLKASVTYE